MLNTFESTECQTKNHPFSIELVSKNELHIIENL